MRLFDRFDVNHDHKLDIEEAGTLLRSVLAEMGLSSGWVTTAWLSLTLTDKDGDTTRSQDEYQRCEKIGEWLPMLAPPPSRRRSCRRRRRRRRSPPTSRAIAHSRSTRSRRRATRSRRRHVRARFHFGRTARARRRRPRRRRAARLARRRGSSSPRRSNLRRPCSPSSPPLTKQAVGGQRRAQGLRRAELCRTALSDVEEPAGRSPEPRAVLEGSARTLRPVRSS